MPHKPIEIAPTLTIESIVAAVDHGDGKHDTSSYRNEKGLEEQKLTIL
jgi:hypothetical protein